jgi:hypothetical protein
VRSYRPWLQRRIDASALSPFQAGLGIAAALLGAFFAWHALGWALGVGDPRDRFFWQQMFGPNAIGLASWVGAALVDVAIEAALR